jgi:hypothetical protein
MCERKQFGNRVKANFRERPGLMEFNRASTLGRGGFGVTPGWMWACLARSNVFRNASANRAVHPYGCQIKNGKRGPPEFDVSLGCF